MVVSSPTIKRIGSVMDEARSIWIPLRRALNGLRREFYRRSCGSTGEAQVSDREDVAADDAARSRDARAIHRDDRTVAGADAIARQWIVRRGARYAVPSRRMDRSPGRT